MDNAVFHTTTSIGNIAHRIALMRGVRHLIITEAVQHQRQVNQLCSCDGIGLIRNKVLVEPVVAALCQLVNDTLALTVQIVGIETHTAMQSPRSSIGDIQQLGNNRVLNVITHTPNLITLARMQIVSGTQLLALHLLSHIHLSTQIAQVLEIVAQANG